MSVAVMTSEFPPFGVVFLILFPAPPVGPEKSTWEQGHDWSQVEEAPQRQIVAF